MTRILIFLAGAALCTAQPKIQGVAIFPASNIWNVPVDHLSLTENSDAVIAELSMKGTQHLHLDDVMPITVAHCGGMKLHTVGPGGGDNDPGTFCIPPDAVWEGGNANVNDGGDHHVLVVDLDSGILYEAYNLTAKPPYSAYLVSKWDLASNAQRSAGGGTDPEVSSCDAAGFPIAAGVLRYQDILDGVLVHALRVSVGHTANGKYIWPATHFTRDGKATPISPPFGTRMRLKESYDISRFSKTNQIILNGLKKYGLMIADNGMYGGMQHDQDSRWDAQDLLALHDVPMSAFEVVDESGLMSSVMQATGVQPPPAGAFVSDKLGRSTVISFKELAAQIAAAGQQQKATPPPPAQKK
jgi:hypothetical protein